MALSKEGHGHAALTPADQGGHAELPGHGGAGSGPWTGPAAMALFRSRRRRNSVRLRLAFRVGIFWGVLFRCWL